MNAPLEQPTRVRYGVLGFCGVLSMVTYLDRVCFGTVAPIIQKEFGFTETQKGWIFGAFALAYAVFEVPTGWLGDIYGPRRTLIRIVLWWSAFTAFTALIYPSETWPWFGFAAMVLVRFLFGVGEAGAYPNIARAFHNWFPFKERGSAKGAVWMAGRFAGGITPLLVFGLLTVTTWRNIFFIFGSLGIVWCILFYFWFRDHPHEKAGVNQAEIDLIHEGETHGKADPNVPWHYFLKSGNLWLLCGMYFCGAYGWYFNITYLPGFLDDYFGISYKKDFWLASFLTGLPLLAGSVACLIGGLLTDLFIKRTGDRKWGRRLFGIIGHSICAACYFGSIVAFQANSVWGVVTMIALASFWNDITMGAAWASCLDIGRRYSGIVAGCMNTIGNLGGFMAGVISGKIIDYYNGGLLRSQDATEQAAYIQASRPGWTVNLIVFGSVYVVATFLWLRFDATKPVVPDRPTEPVA